MGKYLDLIQLAEKIHKQTGTDQEPTQRQRCPVEVVPLGPGNQITWGADGKQRGPATVDFLHADSDGTVWAFVTLPDGWAAVNAKHVKRMEEGDRKL
jgi:hypothetical protein